MVTLPKELFRADLIEELQDCQESHRKVLLSCLQQDWRFIRNDYLTNKLRKILQKLYILDREYIYKDKYC